MKLISMRVLVLLFWFACGVQAGEMVSGKSYMPDDLGTNRVRGVITIEDETIGRGVPEWRGFSYRSRCIVAGGNSDVILSNMATESGHPEVEFSGRNHDSHSTGAIGVSNGAADSNRTICVMAYHSQWSRYRAMEYWDAGIGVTRIPMIIPCGAFDDNSHVCESGVRYMRRYGRGNWTALMEKGASHTRWDDESRQFVRLWLEDVIDWRVPDDIPLDDYPVLKNTSDTNGWFVNYDLIYDSLSGPDRFENPVMYSAADLPGYPGEYVWVPSRRVAEAFVNYKRRGNIEGNMEFQIAGAGFKVSSFPSKTRWVSKRFESSNGDGNTVWSLVSGSLPEGATVNSKLGRIDTFSITNNSVGVHEFTIEARDKYGKASRDIRLLIQSDNNAHDPVAGIVSPASGAVYTEGQPVTFTGTGTDIENGNIVSNAVWYSSIDQDIGRGGSLVVDNLSTGRHVVTLTVFDDEAAYDYETIYFDVLESGSNSAPVISPIAEQTVVEDTGLYRLPLSIMDVDDDRLLVSITSSDQSKVNDYTGIFLYHYAGARTLTILPEEHATGAVDIQVTVDDGRLIATNTFTLNITAREDSPSAVDDDFEIAQGTTNLFDVLANDVDPEDGTGALFSVSGPNYGSAVVSSGQVQYGAPNGWSGIATFTYVVKDSGGLASTGTVKMLVLDGTESLVHLRLDETGSEQTTKNDGTLTSISNAPVAGHWSWSDAQIKGGMRFDGVNRFVNLGQPSELDFDPQADDFTVSCWFKVMPEAYDGFLISKGTGYSSHQYALKLEQDSPLVSYTRLVANSGGNTVSVNIDDDTWSLATLVNQGSTFDLYLNGIQVAGGVPGAGSNASDVLVGAARRIGYPDDIDDAFAGEMDDVRIYGRALAAGEVLALYQQGVAMESPTDENTYSPDIWGTPDTYTALGFAYTFTPQVSDGDDDTLLFSIANKPSWATFDPDTGALSGSVAPATTYSNIVISVSDGRGGVASLPAFDIVVTDREIVTDVQSIFVPEDSTHVFKIRLRTAPASDTTVSVARISGDTNITVDSGSELVFTTLNWSNEQAVVLAAAEDPDEFNSNALIQCSSPGLSNAWVTAVESDNDIVGGRRKLLFDFGYDDTRTVGNWNYVTKPITGMRVWNAMDTNGLPTGIGLQITHEFLEYNDQGEDATDGRYPLYVQEDGLTTAGTSTFELIGLEPSLPCTLTLFGSRELNSSYMTGYTVNGVKKILSTYQNTQTVVEFLNILPSEDGRIQIDVNAEVSRGYIHALEVDQGWGDPLIETDLSNISIPEGGTNTLGIKLSLQPQQAVTVSVARVSGGDDDITVTDGSILTFTTNNWGAWQYATLQAADDPDWMDGMTTVRCSAAELDSIDVVATEIDKDEDPDHILPFEEPFEDRTLGDLAGQHGWSGDGTVQTGTVYEGTQALALIDGTASHTFVSDATNIWVTLWTQPTVSDEPPSDIPTNASAVFYMNTNRQLVAYNSTNAVEIADATVSNGWNKIAVSCDFISKVWNLELNDAHVVTNFDFYGSSTNLQGLEIVEGSASNTLYVDSITVSDTSDGSDPSDTDADGLPDRWEEQYWPGDLSSTPATSPPTA